MTAMWPLLSISKGTVTAADFVDSGDLSSLFLSSACSDDNGTSSSNSANSRFMSQSLRQLEGDLLFFAVAHDLQRDFVLGGTFVEALAQFDKGRNLPGGIVRYAVAGFDAGLGGRA